MKKIPFFFATIALLFSSCSSDSPSIDTPDFSVRNVPVSIQISSDNEFSTLRSVSPAQAGLKSITYLVYKTSDGSYVKYKSLTSGDLSVINDTLPEGQYKVAIFGTTRSDVNNSFFLDIEDFPGADQSFDKASYKLSSGFGTSQDYFYKDLNLDLVNGENTQSVVLDRQTAKVEILPQDQMPADVSSVSFYFDLLGGQSFSFATQVSSNIYKYKAEAIPSNFVLGKTLSKSDFLANGGVSMLLFPFAAPDVKGSQEVAIKAVYFIGNKMYTKVIKTKYTLERNKILRLKGNLFTTNGVYNPSITVDDEWDAEVVEENFD